MRRVVEVSNLNVVARGDEGGEVPIVKDVSFSIEPGEVLALIGESGSGKTTIALTLLGYARRGCRIAGGRVSVGGTDVLAASPAALRDLRGRRIAYVAQSASASFNPALRIIDQVIEGVCVRRLMSRRDARARLSGCSVRSRCRRPRRSAIAIRIRCRGGSCNG